MIFGGKEEYERGCGLLELGKIRHNHHDRALQPVTRASPCNHLGSADRCPSVLWFQRQAGELGLNSVSIALCAQSLSVCAQLQLTIDLALSRDQAVEQRATLERLDRCLELLPGIAHEHLQTKLGRRTDCGGVPLVLLLLVDMFPLLFGELLLFFRAAACAHPEGERL